MLYEKKNLKNKIKRSPYNIRSIDREREREEMGSSSGEWLEKALLGADSGVELDADLISGLVSFCELAPPPDAADYLRVMSLFYFALY